MPKVVLGTIKDTGVFGVAALKLPEGTIVQVVGGPNYLGTVLMKTNDRGNPFIDLEKGVLWGTSIGTHKFEVITEDVTLKSLNYE